MSRVTPEEVRVIIETTLTDPVIQVWIDAASNIVDCHAECMGSCVDLAQVELYLSAHFVGMLDPSVKGFITEEGPAGFKTKYSNPVEMKNIIDNTTYGTTANMLSNGCLASVSDKLATVGFF